MSVPDKTNFDKIIIVHFKRVSLRFWFHVLLHRSMRLPFAIRLNVHLVYRYARVR